MHKINGFTLIELLIVLSVISILSLLVLPGVNHLLAKHKTKQFLEILNSDILLVQSKAIGTTDNVRITFDQDAYTVFYRNRTYLNREMPTDVSFTNVNNTRIQFDNNGSIIQPTTYLLKDHSNLYRIVFPFGKGRNYIEKN